MYINDDIFVAHSVWQSGSVLYEVTLTRVNKLNRQPFIRHSEFPDVEWSEETPPVIAQTSFGFEALLMPNAVMFSEEIEDRAFRNDWYLD
ncbi:hypothetical protein DXT89_15555 [Agrobacterium vitis]|uniref:Uncharacterized protein n=2 Tax=Agrobacterium vitis TaxID=373 RepID=A0A368NEJ8_AGRVI|nr:hypothetical protein DXM22_15135 [Agrobacterium vitis]KAA3525963.1 hypothetical protein DXT89_15555 [Agrobacterium vitis]RCU49002.1 hypothetical protein ASB66_024585 [Agrobacterium vitis]